MDIKKEAYDKAIEVLEKCITPMGFTAANPSYQAIWSRDSMITSLGASLVNKPALKDAFKKSLNTLAEKQSDLGQIPNAVHIKNLKADFASIDSSLWFIIGDYIYAERFAFREGRARIMHIDSLIELVYDGIPFGLDIGCGDITLLRPTYHKDSSISQEEEGYFTTRPEDGERIWRRTPFLKVSGRDFIASPESSPLDFLETANNLVKVPYDITKEDFYTARDVPGKDNILKTNCRDYNIQDSISSNKEWLDINKKFLPGLREFQYK
jgi:hypothetical protein